MIAIEQDEVWRDFFFTELTTGLRRGEICGLRWEDFDEVDGTLRVNRSVSTRKAGNLEVGEKGPAHQGYPAQGQLQNHR